MNVILYLHLDSVLPQIRKLSPNHKLTPDLLNPEKATPIYFLSFVKDLCGEFID